MVNKYDQKHKDKLRKKVQHRYNIFSVKQKQKLPQYMNKYYLAHKK